MAETRFISRHPLTGAALHGIEMPGANHLALVDGARIHSVLAFQGQAQAVAGVLVSLPLGRVRTVGPAEWLVVGSDPAQAPTIDGALVVDQSHGRTLFSLTGPDCIAILMRGVAIDLAGGALSIGSATTLAFGHIAVNLSRISETGFELIVGRSFAESLGHDLRQAGRPFGITFGVTGT